jgi:predicted TIM-barrel fold metal-dependent hydrolase
MSAPLELMLVSADSHVSEPAELWETRLPASMRDRAPNFKKLRHREGRPPLHLGGSEPSAVRARSAERPRGGSNPAERLKDMALDGVVAEVLYPTSASNLFYIEEAALQEACVQVYNNWIYEYCQTAPGRLFGLAIISTYDIDHAVAELSRCKKQGLRGAVIWQSPPRQIPFSSAHYDRFWAAAQDLEMPVSLHIHTGHGPSKGRQNYRGLEAYRFAINGQLQEIMESLLGIIFSGVLERFPRLRVVPAENEIGWLPFWLDQADKYFERFRNDEPLAIDKRPSEYFQRQVFPTFFNDATGGYLLARWYVDNCMWSNDYPHGSSTWPNSRDVIRRDLGHLSRDEQIKLVRGNVARLYQLSLPEA